MGMHICYKHLQNASQPREIDPSFVKITTYNGNTIFQFQY